MGCVKTERGSGGGKVAPLVVDAPSRHPLVQWKGHSKSNSPNRFICVVTVFKHRVMRGQHPLLQKVATRLFEVSPQSASVERVSKAERVIHSEKRSRLSDVTVQMLLYLYFKLRLVNKLTSEMGNIFTDAMRDSNSDDFEEMVDPITCTLNKEPEESLDEIDETLTEK